MGVTDVPYDPASSPELTACVELIRTWGLGFHSTGRSPPGRSYRNCVWKAKSRQWSKQRGKLWMNLLQPIVESEADCWRGWMVALSLNSRYEHCEVRLGFCRSVGLHRVLILQSNRAAEVITLCPN